VNDPIHTPEQTTPAKRRQFDTLRANRIIQSITRLLAAAGISPNAISLSSIFFALIASAALILTSKVAPASLPQRLLFITAILTITLRMLANLFDGLVAIQFNRASTLGLLYNEAPDRISDALILIALGYASTNTIPALGWAAACAAILIAYIRVLGVTAGANHHFLGPMSKPQRMYTVILTSTYLTLTPESLQSIQITNNNASLLPITINIPTLALSIILLGSVITIARRLRAITRDLRNQTHAE